MTPERALKTSSLLAIAAALPLLSSGCSGTGAPAEPAELAALRSIANDHLTALLLIKRWFAILHVRGDVSAQVGPLAASQCAPGWEQVDPRPRDPPGSERWRGVMSDCTIADVLYLVDGAGSRTTTFPDGRQNLMTWQPSRWEGVWVRQDFHERYWDGAQLDYESGYNTASDEDENRLRGTASLKDGRAMGFRITRTTHRDELVLTPDGGSRLSVHVPVRTVPGAISWPVFTEGAEGTYASPGGSEQAFKTWSSGPDRWEQWTFGMADGTKGEFVLREGLAGSGLIERQERLLAVLRWDEDGGGVLNPVGAQALEAVASAAARDFAVDQWVRNIATLWPMPRY